MSNQPSEINNYLIRQVCYEHDKVWGCTINCIRIKETSICCYGTNENI